MWLPVDIAERANDLATIDAACHDAAGLLAEQTATAHDRRSKLDNRARAQMREFGHAYPREVEELDARIESAAEYRAIHDRVATDDLPCFGSRLPSSAQGDAIHEIAGLSAEPTATRRDPPAGRR